MNLFPSLEKAYTKDQLSAREAQRNAEFIAFGPIVFQISRLMVKLGILNMLRESEDGLTVEEISSKSGLSQYAVKILTDSSLTIGTILINPETDKFTISKTGWFLLTDKLVNVNMDFNNDVNYNGLFRLEESLKEGRPAGLEHFGDWETIYEGLSQLPAQVQKSWFNFDHFYSDSSFDEALQIVFGRKVNNLLDVGGNTGRWALRCVDYDSDVNVTIMDLPQQLVLMKEQTKGLKGYERIHGYGTNLLDENSPFPTDKKYDVIWMSQFLDCFSEDEIVSILSRGSKIMGEDTRLCIMETLWDRQKYEPVSFCLTQISVYFTAMANGNSKMYHSDDMIRLIEKSGLKVEKIYDLVGYGHSIIICKK